MIKLQGVRKSFDRTVLAGVDVRVPRGCLFGLIGPAAGGKSVVLKIIAGLMRPDEGTVEVDARDVLSMDENELAEHRKGIGMVFQNNALFDFMTVEDNVAFPLRRLFHLDDVEVHDQVTSRLEAVGLPGFGDRMPSGLSGGQKRRVGVARATVTQAPVILCDEPAAGLDPVSSQRVFDLLRKEQRRSEATVIMVSSDIDRLLSVTDRVGMLHEGRMVFEGTTDEARRSDVPSLRQFLRGETEGPL